MKRLAPLSIGLAMLIAILTVSSPTAVNAQGAGFISSVINRMERNHQNMRSLRAKVDMVKYNAQIRDEDKYVGTVIYVPAVGRNANVRVDWQYPQKETLSVFDGQYTLFRPRLNMAYVGRAAAARGGRANSALAFLNMSRKDLQQSFSLQYLSEETLWGGVNTSHIQLVPKGNAGYKYAEVWVDGSGMPVQTKVVEKNDDSTTIRLTNMEKNAGISPEAFSLKLDSSVKIVKG
ncbi:MAG: outer membrane lipoprotein carrier protein LolA [Pyrinomonadaceae bacterium]|nr:outer membrane lipoprotein carrier protein LolA [Pyrinomonadaceae bacterium]